MGADAATSKLGKYTLLAHLGGGGMADVFLAVAPGPKHFQKLLVLKVMRPLLASEPEFVTMFENEAQLAAKLNHPNVVQTYEVGHEGANHFLVMEYLDGCSLGQLRRKVRRTRGLPQSIHLRILNDVLTGLHYAHELTDYSGKSLGIVHRDVTSQNVFITYDGQVKMLDFGIAKATANHARTESGVLKGTIRYMSPEAMLGEGVDRRSDVFSVGVLLWEALTGRSLWRDENEATIIRNVTDGCIPSPRLFAEELDEDLERLCMRCLARYPDERFESCLALQKELEAVLAKGGMPAARDVADVISRLFASKREETARLIHKQLESLQTQEDALSAPKLRVLSLPQNSMAPEGSQARTDMTRSMRGGTGAEAAFIAKQQKRAGGWRRSLSRRVPLVVVAGFGAMALAWVLLRSPEPSPAKAHGGQAGAGLESGAMPPSMKLPERGKIPSPSSRDAASRDADRPKDVQISIRATPPHATIYFGERKLGQNPVRFRHAADANLHEIRVEAPGYHTKEISSTLEGDLDLDLNLDPVQKPRKKKQGKRGAKERKGRALDVPDIVTADPWAG